MPQLFRFANYGGLRTHARLDPTNTTAIRRAFERKIVQRFKKLRAEIKAELTAENFGLDQPMVNARFNFPRSAQKVEAFQRWLKRQSDAGILEVTQGTALGTSSERAWTSTYVRASYERGVDSAAKGMRKSKVKVADGFVEAAFDRPIHADRVGIAYTRTYSSLEGITRTMEAGISHALASGLAEGKGMKEIADSILDRVDKIGITRARVLARTETIAAHAEATLNTYEEAGIQGVSAMSEFATAGDNKVCPKCEELDGEEYTIQEARGVIPVHPNCRCAWLPVITDGNGKRIT